MNASGPMKYPRTPYWPSSPAVAPDGRITRDPAAFIGQEIVMTEKLDGGNTLLYRGNAYGRSVSMPATAPWFGLVKKHHAWKTTGLDCYLYGEDIYGVHSIAYAPVSEDRTFYAFALRRGEIFESHDALVELAGKLNMPVVPVLWRGRVSSVEQINRMIADAHAAPSGLGGEREGVVLRLAEAFHASAFEQSVVKSVRAGHVQTDEHWSRNWQPCRLIRAA